MDIWKFYDITHRDHLICNPISSATLDEVIGLLDLTPGARVLDLACGKAELLLRLAERFRVSGTGVDKSPFCIRDARERARRRAPQADLKFIEADAASLPSEPHTWDLACCLGASWIFRGHRGTLRALADRVRPGGLVLVAEPFWRGAPDPAHLAAEGMKADEYDTHAGNVAAGVELGLAPLFATTAAEADWDRYEGLQWRAAELYAAAHPEDSDGTEVLTRVRRARDTFLRWGREAFGQGIYLFRR